MICRFAVESSDPFLYQSLEGVDGLLTSYSIEFRRADGCPWYLVGATGFASSPEEWDHRCRFAIYQAQMLLAGIEWMADQLDLSPIDER